MKTILVDAVNTFFIKGHGIYKEMLDLLESFPSKKIIVSNANDDEIKQIGLENLPYELFTLKHDPDKTDPRYFEILLASFGFSKGDVIYFEHNLDAVKSAQSAGIATYHYDPEKKDLNALKTWIYEKLQ